MNDNVRGRRLAIAAAIAAVVTTAILAVIGLQARNAANPPLPPGLPPVVAMVFGEDTIPLSAESIGDIVLGGEATRGELVTQEASAIIMVTTDGLRATAPLAARASDTLLVAEKGTLIEWEPQIRRGHAGLRAAYELR